MLSTSVPNRGRPLAHVAHTCVEPSGSCAVLMIWKRSARLACPPPSAGSVVDSVTTKPGKAGLRPGRPGLVVRRDALRRSASFVLKARSTRMPAPPVPWMELASGENAWPVTAVVDAVVEVVELTAAVDFFLPPPDEQAASTSADATKTSTNR